MVFVSNGILNIFFGRVFHRFHNGGVPKNQGVRRDVPIHIRTGRDQHIVSDGDLSDNNSVHSNPDAIADHRGAFSGTAVCLSENDALVDIAVFSDDNGGIDANVEGMAYIEAFPDRHEPWNLIAAFFAVALIQDSVKHLNRWIARSLNFAEIPQKPPCISVCSRLTVTGQVAFI